MTEGRAIEERFVRVARTARFYILGAAAPAPRQAWLACHGYGQLAASFVQAFHPIADESRIIVAPEALNRYYPGDVAGPHGPDSPVAATWMTREDRLHEIDDYVAYLDRVFDEAIRPARPRAVIAFGFSQGAATVARWAARTQHRVDRVVLWGSPLPPELAPSPELFRGASLVLALGSRDRFMRDEMVRNEEERMRRGGLPFQLHRYDGGHRIDPAALARLAAPTGEAPEPEP